MLNRRNKIIIALATGLTIASFILAITADKPQQPSNEILGVKIKTVKVKKIEPRDSITTFLMAKGTVVPKFYTRLKALTPGTVQYLTPIGAKINKGEQLFILTDANIEQNFHNASQSLAQAEANLEQVLKLNEESLKQAQIALSTAQTSLELAQNNLTLAQQQADQLIISQEEQARVIFESGFNLIDQILRFLSNGNLQEYKFRQLPTLETQTQRLADAQFLQTVNLMLNLPKAKTEDLLPTLEELVITLQATKKLVDQTLIILNFAVANSISRTLSQSAIDNYKSQVTVFQSQLNNQNAQLQSAINRLKEVRLQAQAQKQTAQSESKLAQLKVKNTQSSLDSIKRSNKIREVSARRQLTAAQNQFSFAQYQFNNLRLTAPFPTHTRTRREHRVQLRPIHWQNKERVRELKKKVDFKKINLTRPLYD